MRDSQYLSQLDEDTLDEHHRALRKQGKCVDYPLVPGEDPWYDENPPRGRRSRQVQRHRAQLACGGCPVKATCLIVVLHEETEMGASWGYWAGTIPSDREAMLLALDLAAEGVPTEEIATVVEDCEHYRRIA